MTLLCQWQFLPSFYCWLVVLLSVNRSFLFLFLFSNSNVWFKKNNRFEIPFFTKNKPTYWIFNIKTLNIKFSSNFTSSFYMNLFSVTRFFYFFVKFRKFRILSRFSECGWRATMPRLSDSFTCFSNFLYLAVSSVIESRW